MKYRWYNNNKYNIKVYNGQDAPESFVLGYILHGEPKDRLKKYQNKEIENKKKELQLEAKQEDKRKKLEIFNNLLSQERILKIQIKLYPETGAQVLEEFYKNHPIFLEFEGLSKPLKKKLYLKYLESNNV